MPNRAGMITFNYAGHVLVLSALASPHTWVFPKGHIEPNEASYEAAQREVLEEAGVFAPPDMQGPLGTTEHWFNDEHVVVEWWTGRSRWRVINKGPYEESNFRHVRWMPPDKALGILSFGDLRNILRKALCLPEDPDDNAVIFTNVLDVDETLRS